MRLLVACLVLQCSNLAHAEGGSDGGRGLPLDLGVGGTAATPPTSGCATVKLEVGAGASGYRATGQQCDGVREGRWRFAFLSGEKLREGDYKRGLEQGKWRTFHKDGGRLDEGRYADGHPDGVWVRYFPGPAGKKAVEGAYKHGLRDGLWRKWYATGEKYEERNYADGRREGPHLRWDEKGRLVYVRTCASDTCVVRCQATKKKSCSERDAEPRAEKVR